MDVHRANRFIACIRQVVHLRVSQPGVVSFRKQRRKIRQLYYQLEGSILKPVRPHHVAAPEGFE